MADWNFSNPLVADWIEILAFTRPIRPMHTPSHMSEKGMKMLLSKGKLPELKSIDFDMCKSCILGKQKNVSFLKTSKTPKAEKLELVYINLWGPSSVASLGGSRYYITFIDDSSKKV